MKASFFTAVATALLSILASSPLHAATFTVVADQNVVNRCDLQTGNAPVFGGCTVGGLDIAGRSELGSLGVRGSLTASGSSSGSVSASIIDELTFSISDGQFVIPVDIAGTLETELDGPSIGSSAVSGVSFTTSSGTVFNRNLVETTVLKEFRDSVGVDGVNSLILNIVGGKANLSATLNVGVSCSGSFFGGTCSADASFFSSARFLGGSVFDNSGTAVAGATVTSSSGFDYLSGVDPHNVSAVPLPMGFPMLIAGLISLGWVSTRRSA